MELSLIGLNAAGKTSLVNVIAVSALPPVVLRAPALQQLRNRACAVPRVLRARGCCARRHRVPPTRLTRWAPLAQTGAFSEDMIPTVGFNMRKVTKGNVSIKARHVSSGTCSAARRALTRAAQLWDLGGQSRFRSMWERYCRGVNAIV